MPTFLPFLFFQRRFLTLYQDIFCTCIKEPAEVLLHETWKSRLPEIRALLFEVPPNVIPETTQTTTLLVLWEGQERVMDTSPVHLLRYRLLPKHQRFKKRYTNIWCSNYHNTGIDGNLKQNTKWRSVLNCVLLRSLTNSFFLQEGRKIPSKILKTKSYNAEKTW